MKAMEEKLFRKLKDEEKNDEFIAVESRTFLQLNCTPCQGHFELV